MKKKFSYYLLAFALVLSMAGCNKKEADTNSELQDENVKEDEVKSSEESGEDELEDTEPTESVSEPSEEPSEDENANPSEENNETEEQSASSAVPESCYTPYTADKSLAPIETISGIEVKDGGLAVKPCGELGDIKDFESELLKQCPEWENGYKFEGSYFQWGYKDGKQAYFVKNKRLISSVTDTLDPNFNDTNYSIEYDWDNRISADPCALKVMFGTLPDINKGREYFHGAACSKLNAEFLKCLLDSYREPLSPTDGDNSMGTTLRSDAWPSDFSMGLSRDAQWAVKTEGVEPSYPYLCYQVDAIYRGKETGVSDGSETSLLDAFTCLPYDLTQFSSGLNPLALDKPDMIWLSSRVGAASSMYEFEINGYDKQNQKVNVNAKMDGTGEIYSLYYKFEELDSKANSKEELKAEICTKLKDMLGVELSANDITIEDGDSRVELSIPAMIFNKSTIMDIEVMFGGYNDNPEFNMDGLYIHYNIYENR